MPIIAKKFTAKKRVVGSLIILCFFLILLVAAAELGEPTIGFHISLVLTFLIGTFSSVCQNTMIALAS